MKNSIVISLIVFVSCTINTYESTSKEQTDDPVISKLIFDAESGFDKYYNLFGKVSTHNDGQDESTTLHIYQNEFLNTRFSLPDNWIIVPSRDIVYANIEGCIDCYFTIMVHDQEEIDMTISEYFNEIIIQLRTDSIEIVNNIEYTQNDNNDIENYLISGNASIANDTFYFKSQLFSYNENIYDIAIKQRDHSERKRNEFLFDISCASIVVAGKSLIPKSSKQEYKIGVDNN